MRGQAEPPKVRRLSLSQRYRALLRAATDRREMGALHGRGGGVLSGMSVTCKRLDGKDHRLRREEGPLDFSAIHPAIDDAPYRDPRFQMRPQIFQTFLSAGSSRCSTDIQGPSRRFRCFECFDAARHAGLSAVGPFNNVQYDVVPEGRNHDTGTARWRRDRKGHEEIQTSGIKLVLRPDSVQPPWHRVSQ